MFKKICLILLGVSFSSLACSYDGDSTITVDTLVVKEDGSYVVYKGACTSGNCTACSDFWGSTSHGLSGQGLTLQVSVLLAAHSSGKKVSVYWDSEAGQCRVKRVSLLNS